MNDEQDIDIREKETVYAGFFRMERYRLRHRKFDGSWTRKFPARSSSAAMRSPSCSTIRRSIPSSWWSSSACRHISPAGRPGASRRLPEVVKPGEELADVARREALEETGCEIAGDVRQIAQFMASIGGSTEIVTVFYGAGRFADG